jgi:hypothetical protein
MSGFPGLVGPVENVDSLSHAALNNVAIVLRNGVFDRVVTPGRRFMRGFRAPALGSLQVIQVNTGSVSAALDLAELHCSGGVLAFERITLGVEVQINPDANFAGIADMVRRYGATFSSVLQKDTRAALEQHVRRSIQNRTPDELFEDDLAYHLGASRLPIPIGSIPEPMRLTHLVVEEAVWHDGLAKARRQSSELMAKQVDATVEAGAMMARIDAMRELSARTGIPAALLADPDIRALEAQRWDVVLKLLEPANRAALTRHPELLEAAMSVFQSRASEVIHDRGHEVPEAVRATAVVAALPAGSEFTIDQAMAKAWRRAGGGEVAGIAGAAAGRRGTVLVIGAGADPDVEMARGLLARLLRAETVTIHMIATGDHDQVIEEVLRLYGSAASACDMRLEVIDSDGLEELVINLASDSDAASQTVRSLNDPAESLIGAIEELLPYSMVSVALDETVG